MNGKMKPRIRLLGREMRFVAVLYSFCTLFGIAFAQEDSREYQKILGFLEPYRQIDMSFSESGTISEIHVKEGDLVKKDDLIISLDKKVLEAQLRLHKVQAASNASIAMASAELAVASNRYASLSRLKSGGNAHTSEVNRAAAEKKKAESQVQLAKEEQQIALHRVEEIEALIERKLLRSPINGTVLEINREVAETVSPSASGNQEPLAKIVQLDKLRLIVHLPAYSLGNLKVGDKLSVMVLNQKSLDNNREASAKKLEGEIEFLSPSIDPSSETVRAKIVIDNSKGEIRSGAHAYALLPQATLTRKEP